MLLAASSKVTYADDGLVICVDFENRIGANMVVYARSGLVLRVMEPAQRQPQMKPILFSHSYVILHVLESVAQVVG